jgi:spore coat polysaccharide biosynthesis protein SpsF
MVFIIIQARMGSSRLPGKVLMSIGDKPAIRHVIDRARRVADADKVILATTIDENDDLLAEYCEKNAIACFRGSRDDVLDRYYQAAIDNGAKEGDYIVRITGDCPFIDPFVCDEVISLAKTPGVDYASNTIEETFPDGLDCEVFTFEALLRMHKDAVRQYEREHVTQHISRNKDKFAVRNFCAPKNYADERWTLDMPEDYDFLCKAYDGIGKEFFVMEEMLAYLKLHPELKKINQNIKRNEGLTKSLNKEGIGHE